MTSRIVKLPFVVSLGHKQTSGSLATFGQLVESVIATLGFGP